MRRTIKGTRAARERQEPSISEPDRKQTFARFRAEAKRRQQQLQSQLEINAKFNGAFAQATGMDTSKFSAKLRRDLEQQARRTFKAEPPPLPGD
jgi:hypothetical protein